jgi:hypothetical protein
MSGHVILILGCHRSGTSLVARSMRCLGGDYGRRALWAAPDNPVGFFEDQGVLNLDEQMLLALGSRWDDPAPLRADFEKTWPFRYAFFPDGLALLRSRLVGCPIFVLKEPRLCRLLPFWRGVLAEVGCRVSVVHVVRHPMAVMSSLMRRNGMPPGKAFMLWLAYTNEARANVDPAWASVSVLYDYMVLFPRSIVEDIGAALGLEPDPAETKRFATEFVDDALWHEDADDDDNLPLEVRVVWEKERAAAMRPLCNNPQAC